MSPTVSELLRNHVSLSIACVDRLYINGWVDRLQMPGQVCLFILSHLGKPIASPAALRPRHDAFVQSVKDFAAQHQVPVVQFRRDQRKDDIAAWYRSRFTQPQGVVFIGIAQERCYSFRATTQRTQFGGAPDFKWSKQSVYVNHYYFYVQDLEWGPAFIKVGSYVPYPVKLCLNGHEWVKQRLTFEGIPFESLDNGFLSCPQPVRLQAIADSLGPQHVQAFFDDWRDRLPWPLDRCDRAAGYDHDLSIWQLELSLTQVFDRPVQGRHFFEQVIRDNLDLGRPDRVSLLFPTRHNRRTPPPKAGYRTRVITEGVNPTLHVEYKRSHVKQYFKEERALRTETTINDPRDVKVNKGLDNFERLRDIGQEVNAKLLELERVTQDCALSQDELDDLQRPTTSGRQRASALRFGDTRVMALLNALCLFLQVHNGFRNRDLRQRVASLLGLDLHTYSLGRMTYDLRRLRLKGIIERIPRTHRYVLTPLGLRVAFFHTKVHLRILRPGWAAISQQDDGIPRRLRSAFKRLDREIERLCERARIRQAS
jgi:hypothetical protein